MAGTKINVAHPVRLKVLAALARAGEPMSPSDLAEATGISIGTVAYHVRTLFLSGALRLDREARVRGAVEHFYCVDGRRRATLVRELIDVRDDAVDALEAVSPVLRTPV